MLQKFDTVSSGIEPQPSLESVGCRHGLRHVLNNNNNDDDNNNNNKNNNKTKIRILRDLAIPRAEKQRKRRKNSFNHADHSFTI